MHAQRQRIFENQTNKDYAIIGVDTPESLRVYQELKTKGQQNIIPISTERNLSNGITIIGQIIYDNSFLHKQFKLTLPNSLKGRHNAQNLAASFAVASVFGIAQEDFIKAIADFKGLSHRMEFVF